MNFSSYIVLSTLVVLGVVAHAYVVHEQFYPAVVYLSTDKMCLAIMYNFAFAIFLLFGKTLLRTFIGTLRDLEVEQLVDSGRGFLADTILFLVFYAPTIDNREVGTVFLIQYICCVIFMKVFHLTTQIRVSHMFEVGVPRLIVNVKLVALMCLLLGCDVLSLNYFYSVASRSSTFFTWILFEVLTMSTVVLVSICKYSVHMVDLRLDNGWPAKSVCLFYIDLIHDVVSMTLFLVFMLTFFVQNPSRLPIYMMADVIQVARKLAQRLRSFRRYRRISLNMERRFPDATDEEIEDNEHCVICRDSLFECSKAKKLSCGHIFHIDCLRSWLVMQQVCPTCRAEIPADGPLLQDAAEARRAAELPQAAGAPLQPAEPGTGPALQPTAPGAAGAAAAPHASAACGCAGSHAASASAAQAAHPTAPSGIPAQLGAASVSSSAYPSAQQPNQRYISSGTGLEAAAAMGSGTLPPLEDVVAALKRAEDVAKFLREQQDFWMDQVRLVQERHGPGAHGAVGSSEAVVRAMAAAAVGQTAASASAESELRRRTACSGMSASDEGFAPESPKQDDQMAELRRARQELWAKRKSESMLSGDVDGESVENSSPSKP